MRKNRAVNGNAEREDSSLRATVVINEVFQSLHTPFSAAFRGIRIPNPYW